MAGVATAASAIRAHVLENLGTYLEQFEEKCTAAGGRGSLGGGRSGSPHIILDILTQEKAYRSHQDQDDDLGGDPAESGARGSRNQAAFETDLAEIILQLGEDEPSHIVVPALHVNRTQVREIFARQMGRPELTDDPQALTAAARIVSARRSSSAFPSPSAVRTTSLRKQARWSLWSRKATGACASRCRRP